MFGRFAAGRVDTGSSGFLEDSVAALLKETSPSSQIFAFSLFLRTPMVERRFGTIGNINLSEPIFFQYPSGQFDESFYSILVHLRLRTFGV